MALGWSVFGNVIADHPLGMEVVGQLEGQHRIDDFPILDLGDVFSGRHVPVVTGVSGNTATDDDPFHVQFFAEFLAGVVEAPAQAHAAIVPVDKEVDAVEIVPFGIVLPKFAVCNDVLIGMISLQAGIVDNQGQGRSDHPAFVFDTDLPLGKQGQQFGEFRRRPGPAHVRVGLFHDFADIVIIGKSKVSCFQFVL